MTIHSHIPNLQFPKQNSANYQFYSEEHKSLIHSLKIRAMKFVEHDTIGSDSQTKTNRYNFITDKCLFRYLKACNFQIDEAERMLINTLKWRLEFKPHKIRMEEVEHEAKQGMNYVNGFDKFGRPVLYMRSRRQTSTDFKTQLRLMVFLFEAALKLSQSESIILIIDYVGYSFSNAPSISQSKEVLKIFNEHYPERLYKIFNINPPWFFWSFFKIVSPFISPVTKRKIHFVKIESSHMKSEIIDQPEKWSRSQEDLENISQAVQPILEDIKPELLENMYGGTFKFFYSHDEYWEELKKAIANFEE